MIESPPNEQNHFLNIRGGRTHIQYMDCSINEISKASSANIPGPQKLFYRVQLFVRTLSLQIYKFNIIDRPQAPYDTFL